MSASSTFTKEVLLEIEQKYPQRLPKGKVSEIIAAALEKNKSEK